jgi:hypothetical protein
MLDMRRPVSQFDEELLCGTWSRLELKAMDLRFCKAVERAFECKAESRAAAMAVFRTRKSREEVIEAAIEAGWRRLWREGGDLSFVEIVTFIRTQYSGVSVAQIRASFDRRFGRRQST